MSKSKYKYYWSSRLDGKYKVLPLLNIEDNNDAGDIMKGEDKLADYAFIQSELKNMLGRVLTVIDASILEPRQNKAVKDIIRNEFVDEYCHLSNMLISEDAVNEMTAEMSDEEIDAMGEATIEEVAGA